MKRNCAIEVFRCFLMFVIVIYHGCNNGPFSISGINHDVKFGAWILFWATNAFVFISGWYGIKLTWTRVVKFLGLGLYASIILFLVSPIVTGEWHFNYNMGWFGNSYIALMLISPIVNEGLLALEKISIKKLRMAWIAYAVAMFISWCPLKILDINISVSGWYGHSFNTMLFIYVTAYVLRRWEWFSNMSRHEAIVWFIGAQFCHVFVLGITVLSPLCRQVLSDAHDYDSPFVLISGAMLFIIFYKTAFPLVVGRVCVFLAPSVFMVYLLHSASNPEISRLLFHGLLKYIDNGFSSIPFHRVFAVVMGGWIVFFVCIGVDLLRRFVLRQLVNVRVNH